MSNDENQKFIADYREVYLDFIQYTVGKRIVLKSGRMQFVKVSCPAPIYDTAFGRIPDDLRENFICKFISNWFGRIVCAHFFAAKKWIADPDLYMDPCFDNTDCANCKKCTDRKKRSDDIDNPNENADNLCAELFSKTPWALENMEDIDRKCLVFPSFLTDKLVMLFGSYKFSCDESNLPSGYIDTRVIPAIFEFHLDNKKETGTYYTPDETAEYMCRESLTAYLHSAVPEFSTCMLRNFVESEKRPDEAFVQKIFKALACVRICDPAVGCGAFPMKMIDILEKLRIILGDMTTKYQLRREIIKNNIYGIDIDRQAISAAVLRFMLTSEDNGLKHISALEHHIKCGNALRMDLENESYDIVIANPPYGVSMTKEEKILYKKLYPYLYRKYDIYMVFFMMAVSLTKDIVCFITPDKWLSNTNAVLFRKNYMVPFMKSILHIGSNIFKEVSVDAAVSLFSKKASGLLSIQKMIQTGVYKRLADIDCRLLAEPYSIDNYFIERRPVLEYFERQKHRLSDFIRCEYASASPTQLYHIKSLIHSDPSPDKGEKFRIVNTGTIDKFTFKWAYRPLVCLRERYAYPAAFKSEMLALFGDREYRKMMSPKIIAKGLNLMDASLDLDGNIIPTAATLMMRSKSADLLKIVCAILNTRGVSLYFKSRYVSSSYCGGIEYRPQMLNELPVPDLNDRERCQKIIKGVDDILLKRRKDDKADISAELERLSGYVYQLYGFTSEERAELQ